MKNPVLVPKVMVGKTQTKKKTKKKKRKKKQNLLAAWGWPIIVKN
jgi:hypothetical protein